MDSSTPNPTLYPAISNHKHSSYARAICLAATSCLTLFLLVTLLSCRSASPINSPNTGSPVNDVVNAQDVAAGSIVTLPETALAPAVIDVNTATPFATPTVDNLPVDNLPVEDLTTPQGPMATQLVAADVQATTARHVLIPTATEATGGPASPLPTPRPVEPSSPISASVASGMTGPGVVEEAETVTDTVAIQQQTTMSMALMARSFIQILQQPVDATPTTADTPQPNFVADTEPVTEVPLTIILSDTLAPPLPTGQIGGVVLPGDSAPAPSPSPTAEINPLLPAAIQPDGEIRTVRVPILMYHYLSTPPADADIYRRDLSVSPERFAEHLDRILSDGYTVIPLYDLVAYLMQGTPLPPNPVVLTFDDGYRDNYENAFPLLHERNLPATFFIVMEFINQGRPEYLTWEMVREMAAAGMDFEVHGVDHTTLRGRSQADLEFQALRSYETLQNLLTARPHFVSYPAGEYDQQTIAVFQSAGYWAGLTTIQGATHRSDKLFELHRVRIRGTTTADDLSNLLALDW